MRSPAVRISLDELIVDSFAGGGGASLGIEQALGRSPDIAINHDAEAIAMHRVNHPSTKHYCEDVWDVDPIRACAGRKVGLMWLSPDCKHFSKSKGGKPRDKKIRGLAWVAIKWAKAVKPRVICLENVEEFQYWGPLLEDGMPCPLRKGLTFRRFVRQLENLGYRVEYRELVAADYGTPTTRKRLFLIARSDGGAIVWPAPTHGRGLALPWRTAAECISWDLPCRSIFGRKRPLVENTMRRIAAGLKRYVIDSPTPFIVPVTHQGDVRVHGVDEPMRTITGAHRGEHGLVAPYLVPRYGERPGQDPRAMPIDRAMPTVVPTANGGELVTAFLAKHFGGHMTPGCAPDRAMHTITAKDHHGLVASTLVKMRHHSSGVDLRKPLHTVAAGGFHFAEVRAFLLKFYGTDQDPSLFEPMHTLTTKHRMGLVTVAGEDYAIADIGMRMLEPRELFRAQGFPEAYIIERDVNGEPMTKTAQVKMCGNSVCPPLARAIVEAQFGFESQARTA
jgi:DNA (cytosine-5)-methyltransferase 1